MAQKNKEDNGEVMMYMEDGSIYIGELLGANQTKNFLLNTGDTITINPFDISKRLASKDLLKHPRGSFHYKEGYFLGFETGPGTSASGHISGIVGYRLTDNKSIGLGYSRDDYNGTVAGVWLWSPFSSVYGYGRLYLNDKKARLYVDAKVGYGFADQNRFFFNQNEYNGGMNIQPGIGFHFASRKKTKFHLGIYRYMQYTSGTEEIWDWNTGNNSTLNYKTWLTSTVFRFGIEIF